MQRRANATPVVRRSRQPFPPPVHRRSPPPPANLALLPDTSAPTPTAPATVSEGDSAALRLHERADIVTVRSTIAASATSDASKSTPVPVGPIVGGVIAGVVIVLIVAGLWWWWVANTPRERQKLPKRELKPTKPGLVPAPVSYARSRPSHTSTATGKSTEKVPLTSLSPTPPPINARRGSSNQRNVSTSSTAPLNPSALSSSDNVPPVSPIKKYAPNNSSPLALGAPVTVPEPPKWGQAPFVASSGTSASGHSHGHSEDGGYAYSTSPNSTTHLQVPRSMSGAGLSAQDSIPEDAHAAGYQAGNKRASSRHSALSDQSRYSQQDLAAAAAGASFLPRLNEDAGSGLQHPGQAYGASAGYGYGGGAVYGGGYDGGGAGEYGYGGGEEHLHGNHGQPGAMQGYDGYRIDSYYRPTSDGP